MRVFWIVLTSVGVMTLVIGVMSFVYGVWGPDGTQSYRVGGVRGSWRPSQYAFVGTLVAALGSGLVTAGLLCLKTERRWRGLEDEGP